MSAERGFDSTAWPVFVGFPGVEPGSVPGWQAAAMSAMRASMENVFRRRVGMAVSLRNNGRTNAPGWSRLSSLGKCEYTSLE
jgi:hypothetical protein